MVWAASEAYQYSEQEKYLTLAQDLQAWLSGRNDASSTLFNPQTGVCFDGIISPTEINRNSGAESTIESLIDFFRNAMMTIMTQTNLIFINLSEDLKATRS